MIGLKLATAILISVALTGCMHSHDHADGADEHDHDHDHEQHHKAESAEEHHHNDGEIVVEPEIATRFGVKTATVVSGPLFTSVRAAGTFLSSSGATATVTAPISGTVTYANGITVGTSVNRGTRLASINPSSTEGGNINQVALSNLNAAKRELERLKPLYDDQLITAAEYNAARAAYDQAKAAYLPAAGGSVTAPITGVISSIDIDPGQFATAGTPLLSISTGQELTLRIDVPQSYSSIARSATDVFLTLPGLPNAVNISELGGKRISAGEAGSSVPTGYIPVYFSVPNPEGLIAPGTTTEVFLMAENAGEGISVPRSALCEIQGSYFVYEKIGDHAYIRRPVTIGNSNGVSTVITSGLSGGENIVTESVITVRLAENSGAIPEGHTHNH